MELHNAWPSVSDCFHLASYVQRSFILKHVSLLHIFIAKKHSIAWIFKMWYRRTMEYDTALSKKAENSDTRDNMDKP